ncbi:MAG: AGE family epimerase/isomerase [Bacteroidetes bacterium]|nr:AGE family epimerase/isomerase [Bacteroidota bacterium]
MKQLLVLLFLLHTAAAQTTFRSQYLQNTSMTFGYVDSCARFWMKAYDPVNGGFFVNINRQGNPFGTSLKNTLNQSRDAYGFIRAFQMTGDTVYLRYARYALDFIYRHSWDGTYGGWINDLDSTGTPVSPNAAKTAYYQHYAMLGIAAAYEALRDTTEWKWLVKGYDYNEAKLWDKDGLAFGYFDYVKANGTGAADKSFNATVDAVTTHVLHLYLMTGEQKYLLRLQELADNMVSRIASTAASQQIGFAEKYTSAWTVKPSETMTIMGHVLKTAWCLGRIYQLDPNPVYLSTAEMLAENVLAKGYDHQNGGPYKDYNRVTGQMLMWGITDTAKAWWQMEQAVTAGLMLYQLTGKEKYLTMADMSLDFFMKYFVDHVYGDVFENANKYGGFITQWGTTKGGSGKAAYHSIETGYYTYLYGSLLVKKEPATLHYRFSAVPHQRSLTLRPVGLPHGSLRIAGVKRNGLPYTQYDSVSLQLTLPAGTDGIFAVTFAPAALPTGIVPTGTVPNSFTVQQNYPNPFNPSTTIAFAVPSSPSHERLSVRVYSMLGQEVAVLMDEPSAQPGEYRLPFSAAQLSTGTYLARIRYGTAVRTVKMTMLR